MSNKILYAYVTEGEDENGEIVWTMPSCPYCNRKHTHGGYPLPKEGTERETLALRGSHCGSHTYFCTSDPNKHKTEYTKKKVSHNYYKDD